MQSAVFICREGCACGAASPALLYTRAVFASICTQLQAHLTSLHTRMTMHLVPACTHRWRCTSSLPSNPMLSRSSWSPMLWTHTVGRLITLFSHSPLFYVVRTSRLRVNTATCALHTVQSRPSQKFLAPTNFS